MTISEFLLARVAEDEARAVSYRVKRDAPHMSIGDPRIPEGHVAVGSKEMRLVTMPRAEYLATYCDPVTDDREMAEAAAKRALVELHGPDMPYCDLNFSAADHGYFEGPCRNLRIVASVYADHPDYDTQWATPGP